MNQFTDVEAREERDSHIRAMYSGGMSTTEIAHEFSLTHNQIGHILRRDKTPVRPRFVVTDWERQQGKAER